MKCVKRLWKLIALLALAIVLFTISINSPNPNPNRNLAQVLSAGAMFVLTSFTLIVECYFHYRSQRSDIMSAFSLLVVTLYIFILLGAACFKLWGDWMPNAVLWIMVVMYIVTVIWFIGYFFGWWMKTHIGNWDILKGFGGTSFTEFAGGVGILVSIGFYLVYTADSGGLWWAAQLAAMFSLFSAAAWVQRYVLEKPQHPGFMRYGPNLLNSVAALCTMYAIMFPTPKNISVLDKAITDSRWIIFVAWILVLLVWFVSAILPVFKNTANWQTNPPNQKWDHRGYIKVFLYVILTLTFFSLVLLTVIWVLDPTWPSELSQWAAAIAAGLFVLGILLKWLVDKYEDEPDSEMKMLKIFRDIALLGCGVVILIVQISGVGDPASPLSTLYKFILGMMAYSTLIGILIGAYKWSSKRQLHQPTSI